MISLEKYAVAKDCCCIGYFGPDFNIINELVKARSIIERELPGIKIYISCRQDFVPKLNEHDRIIASTDLKAKRNCFGFFQEIRSNGNASPVDELLMGIHSDKSKTQKLD